MQVISIDKQERRFAVSKDPLAGTFRAIDDGLKFERVLPPNALVETETTVFLPPNATAGDMMEITNKKNALLKSADLFVDMSTIHVTLHFEYANGSQKAGPFQVNDNLLRKISEATDEREWSKITNKPVRVGQRNPGGEIISMSHFLRDEWFTF